MKKKGFTQIFFLLVFVILVIVAIFLYATRGPARKEEAKEIPLTLEQEIQTSDNDLKVTALFEEELNLSELDEIGRELNEQTFSSI